MSTLRSLAACFAILLLALTGHATWSQATRTIKIVVPSPPGGAQDFLARLLGEQIGRAQGHTMLIENRPGAGGVIATETGRIMNSVSRSYDLGFRVGRTLAGAGPRLSPPEPSRPLPPPWVNR